MHAASVNPEPGSNSLKNCISWQALARLNTFRVYLDFLFTLFEFVKVINEISSTHIVFVQKFLICCSIFKDQVRAKIGTPFQRA